METITFFPLDVTYRIRNDKAVIYMYGKTADNRRLCVTDPNFKPYFYVLPKGSTASLSQELKSLKVPFRNGLAEVADVQLEEKNFTGKTVQLLKVFTKLPSHVPPIKEEIIKHHHILKGELTEHAAIQDCFEYDIPFAKRYLFDTGIIPLLSTTVTGNFTNERSKVPVFEADRIEPSGEESVKNLRILSFDIETYNPDGKTVQAEKNPVVMVAFYGNDGKEFKKVITWRRFKTDKEHIEFVDGEMQLIERFKEIIEEYQPDIITGYFTDGFDFPYLERRARKYKITLDLGLDYSAIDIDNRNNVTQITGLVHVDVFKFIRRVLARSMETDIFTLEAVATELLGEHKHDVDLDSLAYIWDSRPEELEKFCEYNLHDAFITFKLAEKIMPNIEELVKIVGLPFFAISRMSFSRLVESYIMKQTHSHNELMPNRPSYKESAQRRMQTYQGAFVYQPTPGLYSNVVVFDFRSLYPSIITSHNISPSTLHCECCHETIPGEKYWFCNKRKGFLPAVLENIIMRRMRVKEIIKASPEKNVFLEARDTALKLLANAFYGYLGFSPARWYSLESARSITALGRYYIHKVIDQAQKEGFSVIYSDTDSIFLKLENRTKEDAIKFIERINAELPGLMELEYEGFYSSGLFVSIKAGPFGAKKKYALLDDKNNLKIRGFETVRRNWSFIAKETQERVIEIILKEKDAEKAVKYVQDTIENLRSHKIPTDKVIIFTQLTKPVAAYENFGPHVAVAKRMQELGQEILPGTLIRFVITAGKGVLRDRAKPPEEVQNNDYDADYYINNQIIPGVERIFAVLGYDIGQLTMVKTQSKLGEFFS